MAVRRGAGFCPSCTRRWTRSATFDYVKFPGALSIRFVNEDNALTLSIHGIIDGPRDMIWRCWTESDLIKQ